MVSRLFGKLDVSRHFRAGALCAMAGAASVVLAAAVSPAVLRNLRRSMNRSAPFFEGWSAPHIPGDPSPHVTDAIPDRRRAGGDSKAGSGSRCIPPVQVNQIGRGKPFGGFFPAPARDRKSVV